MTLTWREQMQAAFAWLDRTVLPPVREPGLMHWQSMSYLLMLFLPAFLPKFSGLNWLNTIFSMVIFLPMYFGFFWLRGWRKISMLFLMTMLSVWLMRYNPFGLVYVIYAGVLSVCFSPRKSIAVLLGCSLFFALLAYFAMPIEKFEIGLTVATIWFSALGSYWMVAFARRNLALKLSQDEIRRLAQVAERERISRDLHDLLGHTLSVIALKAELATRLADRDHNAAKREIAEVAKVARAALAEVRSAVTGMRARGLQAELANARLALDAVEVGFEYHNEVEQLPASIESTLAWILREAVTNVIRHAQARRCKAKISTVDESIVFQIEDDGVGTDQDKIESGLRGLRERIAKLNGELSTVTSIGNGMQLRVRLPILLPHLIQSNKPGLNETLLLDVAS